MLSIFIFRRDLRLYDNIGLNKALAESEEVIPCFILDDRQSDGSNEYFSKNAFDFMLGSLHDLDLQLKAHGSRLYLFSGTAHETVSILLKQTGAKKVYVNEDYTPFSKLRDANIRRVCHENGAELVSCFDLLLTRPGEVLTNSKTPYTIFTPFFKAASQLHIKKPITAKGNFFSEDIGGVILLPKPTKELEAGRKIGIAILDDLDKFHNYAYNHDYPQFESTRLSPHNKFGTVSIREVYYSVQLKLPFSKIINELYWRDFFTHIAHFFPHVFGHAFRRKYDDIHWNKDEKRFKAWKEGKTGFPIVDAGMRELNSTGFMHNRVRMIVASFLVKDLHIDWRMGEKYFAQKLVDYDPCVNNGNWQWAASTGCDAQPYFRIFNPWLQQKKYDPDCAYIKKWVPELKNLNKKEIDSIEDFEVEGYPKPIVVHSEEKDKAIAMYRLI